MQFPGRSPSVVYGHAQSPTICARPGRAEYITDSATLEGVDRRTLSPGLELSRNRGGPGRIGLGGLARVGCRTLARIEKGPAQDELVKHIMIGRGADPIAQPRARLAPGAERVRVLRVEVDHRGEIGDRPGMIAGMVTDQAPEVVGCRIVRSVPDRLIE